MKKTLKKSPISQAYGIVTTFSINTQQGKLSNKNIYKQNKFTEQSPFFPKEK